MFWMLVFDKLWSLVPLPVLLLVLKTGLNDGAAIRLSSSQVREPTETQHDLQIQEANKFRSKWC